jgi:peptide/histidine transporter 3/4
LCVCRFLDKAATDPTKYAKKVAAAGVSKLHDEKTTSSDMNRDTNGDDHVFKDQELAVNMNANPWLLCSITQVEEVKLLVRVIPVWFATLMFLVVVAQLSTFFLSQGNSMDLSMGPHFKIPAASLELFGSFTVLVAIPVYDLCFVPLVRRFTHNERGITMLQRMGIGLFISILSMVAAALVEAKRLKAVHDHGLEDRPEETVPITVFWLIPQYSILALAQVSQCFFSFLVGFRV